MSASLSSCRKPLRLRVSARDFPLHSNNAFTAYPTHNLLTKHKSNFPHQTSPSRTSIPCPRSGPHPRSFPIHPSPNLPIATKSTSSLSSIYHMPSTRPSRRLPPSDFFRHWVFGSFVILHSHKNRTGADSERGKHQVRYGAVSNHLHLLTFLECSPTS